MKRLTGALAAVIAVGVLGAAMAGADGEPVGDLRGDNDGGGISRDLKGSTHGHQGKLLRHGISVFGKQIQAEGLVVYINTDRTAAANYAVRAEDEAVKRLSDGATTGVVRVVTISETKLRLLFKPRTIGKPKAYGWYSAFEKSDGALYDRAPNSGYEKHRLPRR
jgi:hypothetical protein